MIRSQSNFSIFHTRNSKRSPSSAFYPLESEYFSGKSQVRFPRCVFCNGIFTAISQKNTLSIIVMPCHGWKSKRHTKFSQTFYEYIFQSKADWYPGSQVKGEVTSKFSKVISPLMIPDTWTNNNQKALIRFYFWNSKLTYRIFFFKNLGSYFWIWNVPSSSLPHSIVQRKSFKNHILLFLLLWVCRVFRVLPEWVSSQTLYNINRLICSQSFLSH